METTVDTEPAPSIPPKKGPRGTPANLVRYPKGEQPAHLAALKNDPDRVLKTKRTLMAELTRVLHKRDGALLADLAESIVKNAIKGNAACLSFLAERLAPVAEKEGAGRVVFEGIRLEVVSGAEGARTSVELVRGAESRTGGLAGGPGELPVTSSAFSQESQESPRDVTLET